MSTVELNRRGLIKLLRDLLGHAQLTQSMVELEREAGLPPDEYPAELLFFRDLILEGEWSEVVNLVQLLSHSESYSDVMYAVERQRFLELLHTQGQPSPPPAAPYLAPRRGEIQEHLQRLERLCPNGTEFATLSCLITLPNLTDHPVFSDWEVKASRHQLFQCVGRKMAEAIYHSAVDRIFPLSSSSDLASDRLVQLVAKGLLYEQCEAAVTEHFTGTQGHPQGIVDLQKCISAVLTKSHERELISQTVSIEVVDRMQLTAGSDVCVNQHLSGAKSSVSFGGCVERVPPANGKWPSGDVYPLRGGQSMVPQVTLAPEPSHAHSAVAIQQEPKTVAYFSQTRTPLVQPATQEKMIVQTEVMGMDQECTGGTSRSPSACPARVVPSTATAGRDSPAATGKDFAPLRTTLFSPLAEEAQGQGQGDHSSLVGSTKPPERGVEQSPVLQEQLLDNQAVLLKGMSMPSATTPSHTPTQSLSETERTASQMSAHPKGIDSTPTTPPQNHSPPVPMASLRTQSTEKDEGGLHAGMRPSSALDHPPPQATRPVTVEGVELAARGSGVRIAEGALPLLRMATPDLALHTETAIDSSTPKPTHSRLVGGAGGVPPTSPVPYVSGTHGLSDTPHRRGVRLRKTLSAAMEGAGGGDSSQGLAPQKVELVSDAPYCTVLANWCCMLGPAILLSSSAPS